MDIIPINFSKDSPSQLLIKSLETHCVYKRLNNSYLHQKFLVSGRWCSLVTINLPAYDKYGSQKIIAALRQLVEWKGLWLRNEWVRSYKIFCLLVPAILLLIKEIEISYRIVS